MRILFIGNSYTYYNAMPTLFESLANDNGKEITVDAVTKGGRRLIENTVDGDENSDRISDLLSNGEYDVLILQEQSCTPLTDYMLFLDGVQSLVRKVSPKRCVLYATWGRKDGAEKLHELGLTSLGMTLGLEMAYSRAAQKIAADVAYVGRAFAATEAEHPELELYNPDGSHPSEIGSVLAALVIYRTVFGEVPSNTEAINIDGWIVDILKEIADGL